MMMIRLFTALAAAGLVAAAPALADPGPGQATPKGWAYDIKDGKRVPKEGNRVATENGGWRQETRRGACVEIKEMTPEGELKITRQCDAPQK